MESNATGLQRLYTREVFQPWRSEAWTYLSRFTYPWEALPGIHDFILKLGAALSVAEYDKLGESTWVHKTATVASTAHIGCAVIIGADTDVRHNAYIRESALVGNGVVVGNSTELKNVILFDWVQVPHFNYVGDSILGFKSHMGAGSITSNVKSDNSLVSVASGETRIETGLRKFGAIIGDNVEVGCNAVLNPGTVIGRGTSIYPLSMVRGYVPPGSIYKKQGEVVRRV